MELLAFNRGTLESSRPLRQLVEIEERVGWKGEDSGTPRERMFCNEAGREVEGDLRWRGKRCDRCPGKEEREGVKTETETRYSM